ncbi:CDP-alcohol phosphatidyltransferase family protein [Thermosulfuriphilus sp.]
MPCEETITFTERVKTASQPLLLPLARLFHRLGISPNTVSVLGFLGCVLVGVLIGFSQLFWAGIALSLFGPLDAVDGLLARTTSQKTKFGAFLDSTLDRYAEIAIFTGFLVHFHTQGLLWAQVATILALSGSLLVSYTRARAEGLGVECRVGIFTRFERILAIIIGLVFSLEGAVVVALALLANLTAIQRIFHVYKATR